MKFSKYHDSVFFESILLFIKGFDFASFSLVVFRKESGMVEILY